MTENEGSLETHTDGEKDPSGADIVDFTLGLVSPITTTTLRKAIRRPAASSDWEMNGGGNALVSTSGRR